MGCGHSSCTGDDGREGPRTHREMKDRVRSLALEHNDPALISGFALGESFRSNLYHGWMEEGAPLVHEFVHRLLAIYRNAGR